MDVKDRRASKLKWLREHTKKFTFLFRLDADAKVIEKLDSCENKTQYVRDLILKDITTRRVNTMESSSMKTRWAVIAQRRYNDDPKSTGDEFVTWCDSQQDAEDRARLDWHHLTDREKRRNTIYAALVELEWDEAFEDWVSSGQLLQIALQLGE